MNLEKIKGKRIKDFTMTELVSNIGVLSDADACARLFYPNYALEEKTALFLMEWGNCFDADLDDNQIYEEVIKLFDKYGEYINKEEFVLECYKKAKAVDCLDVGLLTYFGGVKRQVDKIDDYKLKVTCKTISDTYETALREFLIRSEVDLIESVQIEDGKIKITNFLETLTKAQKTPTANRYLEKIKQKNRKAKSKLEKVDEEIGLENVIGDWMLPMDLLHIIRYDELALCMMNYIYDGETPSMELWNDKNKVDKNKFIHIIKEAAEYVDCDKLLLLSVALRYQQKASENEEISYEETIEFKNFIDKVEQLLDNKEITMLDTHRFAIEVSFQDLARDMERILSGFLNGKYYEPENIQKIRGHIINGEILYDEITYEDYINAMKFTKEELAQIFSNNPKSIHFFIEHKMIEIDEVLSYQNSFSNEGIAELYNNDLIDNEKVFELYMAGKVSQENIKGLLEEDKERLADTVGAEKLVELFENRVDEESQKEWERYSKLYKVIKVDGRENEERNEMSQEVIDCLNDPTEEKLYDLYHTGVVTCDHVIEYIGQDAIELYTSGELKPIDARRLFKEGKISLDMLDSVFKDTSMDDGEKLSLIFSTFSGVEDAKIRNHLLKNLKEVTKGIYDKSEKGGTRVIIDGNKPPKERNGMDPCARWNLIANLDDEYSFNYLTDGHAIFYLPNQGKYIIEKLFDKNNRTAYGAATYILDENVYAINEVRLIENSQLNRQELTALKRTNGVNKIIHKGKWGEAICNIFDIDNENKYSDEKREKIRELLEELEKVSKKTVGELSE